MAEVDPRGSFEEVAFRKLEERGWSVLGASRKGVDLDLDVRFEGTQGTVSFRTPFHIPKGEVHNAEPDPCFVRVDLGEPQGQPTRWALWDRYVFDRGKHEPSYTATVVHEAYGAGWTSVTGGDVGAHGAWTYAHRTLGVMLAAAERLAPSRTDSERLQALWGIQRHNFGAQKKKLTRVELAIVALILFVGPGAYITALWVLGGTARSNLIAGTAVASLPILGGLIWLLVMLVRATRGPPAPVDGMDAVVETLRATGAFDSFGPPATKVRDGLPLVVRAADYVDEGRAPLAISRLAASSSKHPVAASADLCEVRWPDGADPLARLVPDRWLTVDLTGPVEELAKLPDFSRSASQDDTVRWLFTEDEIDEGTVQELFRAAAASWTGRGSPYR